MASCNFLVRSNADGFEIAAGRRRYFATKTVEKERAASFGLSETLVKSGPALRNVCASSRNPTGTESPTT
jgi:hypothetical protein